MSHETHTREPAARTLLRLPAGVFYGVILAGVLLGAFASGGAALLQVLEAEAAERELLMVVAIMTGATFGGILGFAVAAMWDRCRAKPR